MTGTNPFSMKEYTELAYHTNVENPESLTLQGIDRVDVYSAFKELTDVSETLDALKKTLFYNRDLPLEAHQSLFYIRENWDVDGDLLHHSNVGVDVFHGILGILTEAGELSEVVTKVMSGEQHEVDDLNLFEELGDLLWYMALILKAKGWTFEQIAEGNIAKLQARYGDKFSEGDAVARDIANEMTQLKEHL